MIRYVNHSFFNQSMREEDKPMHQRCPQLKKKEREGNEDEMRMSSLSVHVNN